MIRWLLAIVRLCARMHYYVCVRECIMCTSGSDGRRTGTPCDPARAAAGLSTTAAAAAAAATTTTTTTTPLHQVVFQGTSVAAATRLKLTYKGWRGSDTSRPELTEAQMVLLPYLARDLARRAVYLPLKKKRTQTFSEYFIKWAQVDLGKPVRCCCCCCCCCFRRRLSSVSQRAASRAVTVVVLMAVGRIPQAAASRCGMQWF